MLVLRLMSSRWLKESGQAHGPYESMPEVTGSKMDVDYPPLVKLLLNHSLSKLDPKLYSNNCDEFMREALVQWGDS